MKNNEIIFLTLIAGRKSKDELLTALADSGAQLIEASYGKGAYKGNYLQDAFGLTAEEQKVIITCLFPEHKADAVLKHLTDEHHFDKMNTGIAFTVPVEKLSF